MTRKKKLDQRVEHAESRTPKPPPPPKPDAEREALTNLLAYRLRGAPWQSFKSAGEHINAHGDPGDLNDQQTRLQLLLGNILHVLDEKALQLHKMDAADKEQLFVYSLAHATSCELYRLLCIRCWRIEAGDEPYLPPDRDLTGTWNSATGAAWNPISETDRIKEGCRLSRDLAELREGQLLNGAQPVQDGQRANEVIQELFNPAFGNPAQRRRRLERLADLEEETM